MFVCCCPAGEYLEPVCRYRNGERGQHRRVLAAGWYGTGLDSDAVPTLEAAARQRTAEAGGAEVAFSPYVPAEPDENTPFDLVQASQYYLTPARSTRTLSN